MRDGRLLLIDVAFVEARPSPWRQAVDLANMMLCLALRSSPERVYRRALRLFTVEEITEGFAAARGLALPSQLRRMLREKGRDLHGEFVRLLPTPPRPIPTQRWSLRRVGLLAGMVLLLLVLVFEQGLSIDYREAVETPTSVGNLACTDLEPQWLMAQSVPSASLVPCVRSLPTGWSVAQVTVNHGRSVIPLNHDRAGTGVMVVQLTAACDTRGAIQCDLQPPAGSALPADRSPGTPLRGHPLRPVPGRLRHRTGGRAGGKPRRGHQRAGHDPGLHHPAGASAGAGPALGWATAARPTDCSIRWTTRIVPLHPAPPTTAATRAGCSDVADQVDGADQLVDPMVAVVGELLPSDRCQGAAQRRRALEEPMLPPVHPARAT